MHGPWQLLLLVSAVLLAQVGSPVPAGSAPAGPPEVRIVNLIDGQVIDARYTVYWTGFAPDGYVESFEHVLDPPPAFTLSEIEDPEHSPGVTVSFLPGPPSGEDTVRVSKSSGSGILSFDYLRTPAGSREFLFATPGADSVFDPGSGRTVPAGTFSGDHTLYVRSRDDAGGYSAPDEVSFTARTRTPEAAVLLPIISDEVLEVGSGIRVEWNGIDPDGPGYRPVGYLIKLLDLGSLQPPPPVLTVPVSILLEKGGEWTYVDGDQGEIFLPLDPGSYVFGVRAVDEAGAEEPFLELGRNAFKFTSFAGGGKPVLTLSDPLLGTFTYQGTGTVRSASVAGRLELRTSVQCNASASGGVCAGYRWGSDLADPDAEEGWSGWIQSGAIGFVLPPSGDHTLTVEIRDLIGEVTRGVLNLHVVEMTFDREVLLVDDYRDTAAPNDMTHDRFWEDRFQGYGALSPGEYDVFETFGSGDVTFLVPNPPSLDDLAGYRVVVWDCSGEGSNANSGLLQVATLHKTLASYLRAGGRLWVLGKATVAPMTSATPSMLADVNYPKEIRPGDFAWDYMKIRASVDNDKAGSFRNAMAVALPRPESGFPRMEVDLAKLNRILALNVGGFTYADAVFSFLVPPETGTVEEIYGYGATGPRVQMEDSLFEGKLCGLRWHDPSPQPLHGRTLWFGFPLYYFQDEQAQGAFDLALDWLREEVVPVKLAYFSAEREEGMARLRWEVTEAVDHAGFHVFLAAGGERVRLTRDLLRGRREYVFTDEAPPAGEAEYWLAEVSRTGAVAWHGPAALAAATAPAVRLAPVLPNPFTAEASVEYALPEAGRVRLTVVDVRGRRVATLVDEVQEPGSHRAAWDGRTVSGAAAPAGVYLVRLEAGGEVRVRKAMRIR